jgi:hypothetical protein
LARRAGIGGKRFFNSHDNVLTVRDEIRNRKELGREVPTVLYARGILEAMIFHGILETNRSILTSDQIVWLARKLVNRMTLEDLQGLSKRLGETGNDHKKHLELSNFLKTKGCLPIPRTEKEFKAIMGADWERFKKNEF